MVYRYKSLDEYKGMKVFNRIERKLKVGIISNASNYQKRGIALTDEEGNHYSWETSERTTAFKKLPKEGEWVNLKFTVTEITLSSKDTIEPTIFINRLVVLE